MNDLFIKLLFEAQSGEQVKQLLQDHNLLDSRNWKPVGGNFNNYAIIGNQSTTAEKALSERIVNSIDAELLRACKENNIDPTSDMAPQTMWKAAEKFFDIPEGKLYNLKPNQIREITRINLFITG